MIQIAAKYLSIYSNIEDSFIEVINNSPFYNLPGIYMIKNIVTGDIYIGQSKTIGYRLTSHRSLLRAGDHIYANDELDILQKSWNKYGEESFKYYIIKICELKDLDEWECYWINYFKCNRRRFGQGFNLSDGGNHPPQGTFNKGRVHIKDSSGTINKSIKKEELELYLKQGYELGIANSKNRAEKSIATKKKNGTNKSGFKGKKHTKEYCELMSKKAKGRKKIFKEDVEKAVAEKDIAKYLEDSWHLGNSPFRKKPDKEICNYRKNVKLSIEHRKKISSAKEKAIIQLDKENNIIAEYRSLKEAAEKNSLSIGTAWDIVHDKLKRNKYKYGYIFKYKEEYNEVR